jgi:hypothetical protein
MSIDGTVRIGLAAFDLRKCLPPAKPFHDPMEGQVLYACGDQHALWFSLDLLMLSVPLCARIRQELSDQLGVPASHIVLHVTHNHTAPIEEELLKTGYEKWVDCLIEAARRAMHAAEPASVAHIRQNVPDGVFVRRRQHFGPDLGDLCTYMGYEGRAGRPDATGINTRRFERWLGGDLKGYEDQIPRTMSYDRPIDRNLDLLLFRSRSGRPLGAMVRFAAHVIAAGHCPVPRYSAGFPGVLRRLIQLQFGGVCLSLNGPCGDITLFEQNAFRFPKPVGQPEPCGPLCMPHVRERDTWREVARIGQGLFAPFAEADRLSFEPLREMEISEKELHLPMRPDLVDVETAEKLYREHYARFLELAGSRAALKAIKQQVDWCRFYSEHKNFYGDWRYLWPDDLAEKQVRCFVSVLRLGNVFIAGLPGEGFMETGEAVRRAVERNGMQVITATECNGDIGYIPMPADIPGGDYEPNCCVLTSQAGKRLSDATIALCATRR